MKSFILQFLVITLRLALLEAARWLLARVAMAHIDAVAGWHGRIHPSFSDSVRDQLLDELLQRLRTGVRGGGEGTTGSARGKTDGHFASGTAQDVD